MFSGIRQHLLLKFACLAGIGLWIALWYYPPQRWPLFEAQPAPVLWIDHWVPFQPGWALIYQSVFFTHLAAIWLPGCPRAVRRYTFVLGAVYTAAAFVFWFYPTLSPRPGEVESRLYYWLVAAVDGERNAVPSLHAAMGTLSALQLGWHIRAVRGRFVWQLMLGVWWVVFLYSTLATRQHRVIDLLAGIALVFAVLLMARWWRGWSVETDRRQEPGALQALNPQFNRDEGDALNVKREFPGLKGDCDRLKQVRDPVDAA